jgi:50S ribosomal subunit-associated GTPase HflX
LDGERFNFRTLRELEIRKQHQIEITNRFAALENLNVSEDTKMAWVNMKKDINSSTKRGQGLYELKQHKPCFDEECLCFLDQRKQAKMQWLKDPNQNNIDNLNNETREARRHFRREEGIFESYNSQN